MTDTHIPLLVVYKRETKHGLVTVEPSELNPQELEELQKRVRSYTEKPKEQTRHSKFYFADGNIVFLVDNILFKVHRYFFQRDSPVFSTMFTLPTPKGEAVEGETDDKPVKLSGFTSKDFECFLTVIYPSDFSQPSAELTTPEAWTSTLKVASQFDFTSIRTLAIARLFNLHLSVSERIAIARQYNIDSWLACAYTDLCMREAPLMLEEGATMGMEDVIAVYRIRSLVRYSANLNRHHDSIRSLVCKEFRLRGDETSALDWNA